MNNFKYKNISCPVCSQNFKETDDIVVCPDCAAAYHRDCYKKVGKCLFEDKHSDGFEMYKLCPFCNSVINNDSLFCPECKKSLLNADIENDFPHNSDNDTDNSDFENQDENFQSEKNSRNNPFFYKINLSSGGLNSVLDESFTFKNFSDDIPEDDLNKFIAFNIPYYAFNFKNLKNTGSSRFNFASFLFSGVWFLYRKQYLIGSIITLIMLAMTVGSIYFQSLSAKIILDILTQTGLDISTLTSSMDNMLLFYNSFQNIPFPDKFIIFIPNILFILRLAIMVFSGLKANKIYYKSCMSFFNELNLKNSQISIIQKDNLISKKGGINRAIALSILVSFFIINNFLPNVFLNL
ncbi:MAG: RING finger protein [Clostridia bacterium]|nr:RING finger protein [Clostridia bacterium]